MSRLILVRHAQASFFAEDYDQLSALGERQSEQLAAHWIAQNRDLDAIIAGPRVRHQRTAQIVIDAYIRHRRGCPELITAAEWDEHQVDRAITHHQNALLRGHPQLIEPLQLLHTATDRVEKSRQFQRVFEAVSHLWVRNELPGIDVESWTLFRNRVLRGLSEIIARHAGGQVAAVFTSVGPITVTLQHALRCCDEIALATGWRLRNSSITEFLTSGDRFTLDRFNVLDHLQDQLDWTFR